jgi:hypothetical protein
LVINLTGLVEKEIIQNKFEKKPTHYLYHSQKKPLPSTQPHQRGEGGEYVENGKILSSDPETQTKLASATHDTPTHSPYTSLRLVRDTIVLWTYPRASTPNNSKP